MFDNILETTIPIKLDKERRLVFNINTMCAYQKARGKLFMKTVAEMYDAYQAARRQAPDPLDPSKTKETVNPLALLERVDMEDLRALLWACLHEYNAKDEPQWPLSLTQVGRMVTVQRLPELLSSFLQGNQQNSPTKEEMGESAEPQATEKAPDQTAPSTPPAGGEASIALPADAFA